jgi:hypothetical protein
LTMLVAQPVCHSAFDGDVRLGKYYARIIRDGIFLRILAGIDSLSFWIIGVQVQRPSKPPMLTSFRMAGFDWASGSAGTGWNSTVSKCRDIFAAAAGGRSCKSR